MVNKVTKAMLEELCKQVNELLDVENERKDEDGLLNYACHYVTGAFGGVRVERNCWGGGAVDALGTGYVSKPVLFASLEVYIKGLSFCSRNVI